MVVTGYFTITPPFIRTFLMRRETSYDRALLELHIGDTVVDPLGREGQVVNKWQYGVEVCYDDDCLQYDWDSCVEELELVGNLV